MRKIKFKHNSLIMCTVFILLGLSQAAMAGSKYTPAGTITNANMLNPRGIFVDTNQSIWVANSTWAGPHTHAGLFQFRAADNSFVNLFHARGDGSSFQMPHGIDGSIENGIPYLYVSDLFQGIYKMSYVTGTPSVVASYTGGGLPPDLQEVAIGTYQGSPAVYVGSNNSQTTILDTDLTNITATIGPDNPLGVAIDKRSITYMTNVDTIDRFDQNGNPLSSISLAGAGAGFLYGLAIAPSGHILTSDSGGSNSIFVVKPNGLLDFTIDVSAADGQLTHLAVNPLTGRVYLSVGNPDNRVYMFDALSLRAPGTIVQSLPTPPPLAVSSAVDSMTQKDSNYQDSFINLDTPSLQTAVNNYQSPNTTPSRTSAINHNVRVFDVVQNHIDLLKIQEISNGPQNFQFADHQYLSDFKHRGLAVHMQRKSKAPTQVLSGQPSRYNAGFEAMPTLELMNDQKNFSVWMQNAFNQTDNGITPTTDANRSRMHAWTFGADTRIATQSRVGVFAGLSKSNVHLMSTPLTQDDTKKKYLGLYGVHFFDIKKDNVTPILDANLMLGRGHINHARDLSIAAYPMIATSTQHFWDLSTRLRLTVPHHVSESIIISPYVYAGWMYFKENQVTEQGASVFNQSRPSQIFQIAEGSLGTQLSLSLDQSFGIVMPSVKLGITQTGTINRQKVIPIALEDGGSFDSAQVPLKQFSYDVGTSLAFKLKNNLSFVASYLAEYGKNKYRSNEVLIEARLIF